MRRYVERDLWCYRLEVCTEVGCLPRPHVHGIQWRIVELIFREQQHRYYGGIALPLLNTRECVEECIGAADGGAAQTVHCGLRRGGPVRRYAGSGRRDQAMLGARDRL